MAVSMAGAQPAGGDFSLIIDTSIVPNTYFSAIGFIINKWRFTLVRIGKRSGFRFAPLIINHHVSFSWQRILEHLPVPSLYDANGKTKCTIPVPFNDPFRCIGFLK